MNKWKVWKKSSEEWDTELIQFKDFSVYQGSAWGNVKSQQGWSVLKIYLEKYGKCISMVQMQYRKLPFGFFLIWVPGGPSGDLSNFDKYFFNELKSILRCNFFFIRVNFMKKFDESTNITLLLNGWKNSIMPILSYSSVLINTISDNSIWLTEIKGKHRYYVKKAITEKITWVYGNHLKLLEDLNEMHIKMGKLKGISVQSFPESVYNSVVQKNMRLLIGYLNEKPVSGCLLLIVGKSVNYMTAATVDEGRKLSAAYAMIYQLREKLFSEGVTHFDFGGINPSKESAKGVDHFKLGFGEQVHYQGEMEFCYPSIIRYPINFILKSKFIG
jgi:lipid II:glycine glycyltransferase (peptidoglycan interpeptide bridge formation enzyme)